MSNRSETVTILFTDLVDSTQVLERAGDSEGQRIFNAHRTLLREAVGAHGGEAVKWLGDGLMVVFPSAAEAVACAVRMQQASRRPAAGERLRIRVGLHTGEAIKEEADYFGAAVVIARRLCDQARSGQILASATVGELLRGRSEFHFGPTKHYPLKGFSDPVAGVEVVYEHDMAAMLARTPFVGRRKEMGQLLGLLDEVKQGRGALAEVAGEPGVGKTRLTEEFSGRCAESGVLVVYGRSYEGDARQPFGPVIEAVRAHASGPAAVTEASDKELVNRLLTGSGVNRSIYDPSTEGEERFQVLDAIYAWLAELCRQAPVVLILDDLHWSDGGTISLIRHAGRILRDRPLLLLCSFRDTEVVEGSELAGAFATLHREVRHERITLDGLETNEIEALVSIVTDRMAEDETARQLSRETGGNPLFLREVLLHLAEEGWPEGAGKDLREAIAQVPAGVREVIGRRLQRISHSARGLLAQLCAISRPVTWLEVRAISDQPEAVLVAAVEEALASQLMNEVQPGVYDFGHAQARTAVYEGLSAPRRFSVHRSVAEALEKVHGSPGPEYAAEISEHWLAAGPLADKEQMTAKALEGAAQLVARTAYEDAATLCERTIGAIDGDGALSAQHARLLLMLGESRHHAGQHREARKAFEQAIDLARRLALHYEQARASLGYETARFANSPILRGPERDHVVSLLEEALTLVGPGDSDLRARLLARLAWSLTLAEAAQRQALIEEALDIARRLDDQNLLVYVLYARHQSIWYGPQNVEERAASAAEVVRVADQAENPEWKLLGHYAHMHAMLEIGDFQAADADIESFGKLASQLRRPLYMSWDLVFQAMRAFDKGRLDECQALAQRALAVQGNSSGNLAVQMFGAQMYAVRREKGELGMLRGAVEGWTQTAPEVRWAAALVCLYTELGLRPEAANLLETIFVDNLNNLEPDSNWLIAIALISETCVALGETQRAERLYEMLSPFPALNVVVGHAPVCAGPVSRYLGLLASILGRDDDAETHFLAALTRTEQTGERVWTAHTCFDYGAMLLKRARPADLRLASELLRRAGVLAEEIGLTALRGRIADAMPASQSSGVPA